MSKKLSQKKHRIYSEAARLFQEKGYLASSMRELAARVGIEASSLYSHIRSKEELLSKICFEIAEIYMDHWRNLEKSEKTILEKLEELIDFHVYMAWENPVSVTVFNDEWRHLGDIDRKAFSALRKQYEKAISENIKQGIDSGEIVSLDPELISFTLLHGLRWIHFTHRKGKWLSMNTMQKQLKEQFLYGIAMK